MNRKFNSLFGGMLVIGMFLTIGSAAFADAKIDEQVMVPKIAGVGCHVGPHGLHFAAVVPKGSHTVIYFDGVEGPKYDQLLLPSAAPYNFGSPNVPYAINYDSQNPVIFSPDGMHWAYTALDGNNYVVLLDGKELVRGAYFTSIFSLPLTFSPHGNHLYFVEEQSPNDQHFRMVMDGKPQVWSKGGISTVLFSPDGNHYTYNGIAEDSSIDQWSVVDGQQVHYLGDHVQFTENDHLLSVYYDDKSQADFLIADGKPAMKASRIDQVWASPKGGFTLATIQVNNQMVLTVNRQLVPVTAGSTVRGVYFSPDDKHYAAIIHTPNNIEYVLEDGKKGDNYPMINNAEMTPTFSPDSSKFLYVTQSGQQNFLVTNGDESDGFQMLMPKPVFTPDGQHLAYGTVPYGSSSDTVTVDGKVLPAQNSHIQGTFAFSSDGSRFAYKYDNGVLVIDGTAVPNAYITNWQKNNSDMTNTAYAFLFSPDSKHISYIAQNPNNASIRGLWLDQTLVYKTTQIPDHIAFSSDSQHLFWTVREAPDAGLAGTMYHHTLYVDGKKAKEYVDSFFDTLPDSWETENNGTLQFYAIADGAIKRFIVTPSLDANVTTLLTAGGK